jgi:hypothetical protein
MNNVYDSQIPFGFRSITLVTSQEDPSPSELFDPKVLIKSERVLKPATHTR